MSLVINFTPTSPTKTVNIGDEAMIIRDIPTDGVALWINCPTEIRLTTDMDERLADTGGVILRGQVLICALPPELEDQWYRGLGGRPMHPHEQIQPLRQFQQTLIGKHAASWLAARQIKARALGLGFTAKLELERGHVQVIRQFGAVATARTQENPFA